MNEGKGLEFHILLAEDDDEMRSLLGVALRGAGYRVTECRDGRELFSSLKESASPISRKPFDLVISDIRMPGFTGVDVLRHLSACREFPPMILITAFGDERTHSLAKQLGVAAICDKPFDIDDLLGVVRDVVGPCVFVKR